MTTAPRLPTSFSNLRMSQFSPVQPLAQSHRYCVSWSRHVPPLAHGEELQGSSAV